MLRMIFFFNVRFYETKKINKTDYPSWNCLKQANIFVFSFDFCAFNESLLDGSLFSAIIVVLHFVYLPTMISVVDLLLSLELSSVVNSSISIDFLSLSDESASVLENLLCDFSRLVVFDLRNLEFFRN